MKQKKMNLAAKSAGRKGTPSAMQEALNALSHGARKEFDSFSWEQHFMKVELEDSARIKAAFEYVDFFDNLDKYEGKKVEILSREYLIEDTAETAEWVFETWLQWWMRAIRMKERMTFSEFCEELKREQGKWHHADRGSMGILKMAVGKHFSKLLAPWTNRFKEFNTKTQQKLTEELRRHQACGRDLEALRVLDKIQKLRNKSYPLSFKERTEMLNKAQQSRLGRLYQKYIKNF